MSSFSSALITGASGFIGKALANELINQEIKTTCLVRKETPDLPSQIQQLIIPNFTPESILAITQDIRADVVFHLAAYGVLPNARDPLETANINILASVALLESVKNWDLKQFIHIGSCAEYGKPISQTLISEDHTLKPLSVYGASKAAAQFYLSSIAASYDIPFTHLRLFGVYGPGEAYYRLAPYVIKCLSNNQTASLSPGIQIRDFLYINDAVSALIKAAQLNHSSDIFNISSAIPTPVNSIAKTIAKFMNKPDNMLNFGAIPMRPDETPWLVGNNQKFKTVTNWQPEYDLEQGLVEMINIYEGLHV